MRGSYLAGVIEAEQQREQRLKALYAKKKYERESCSICRNRRTDLCHITEDLNGKLRCVHFEKEEEDG